MKPVEMIRPVSPIAEQLQAMTTRALSLGVVAAAMIVEYPDGKGTTLEILSAPDSAALRRGLLSMAGEITAPDAE